MKGTGWILEGPPEQDACSGDTEALENPPVWWLDPYGLECMKPRPGVERPHGMLEVVGKAMHDATVERLKKAEKQIFQFECHETLTSSYIESLKGRLQEVRGVLQFYSRSGDGMGEEAAKMIHRLDLMELSDEVE